MTYHGRRRPLTSYTTALAAAGLAIETIREPLKTGSGQNAVPFLHLLAAQQGPVPGERPDMTIYREYTLSVFSRL